VLHVPVETGASTVKTPGKFSTHLFPYKTYPGKQADELVKLVQTLAPFSQAVHVAFTLTTP